VSLVDSSGWLEFLANAPGADSVILATARAYGAVVWTQDSDFEGLDGVKYTPKRHFRSS
jgi:predicted nucleic acid-binding protein